MQDYFYPDKATLEFCHRPEPVIYFGADAELIHDALDKLVPVLIDD
jgi:hypothetical protein